jgi:hypothetical protein
MMRALGIGRFSLKCLSAEGCVTGVLEDVLIKTPDAGIFLHTGPFTSEGNLESGEGARIQGTVYEP